jgi:hypothetical protein
MKGGPFLFLAIIISMTNKPTSPTGKYHKIKLTTNSSSNRGMAIMPTDLAA